MKITAYIPCYNGASFLPEVLPALLAQTRKADQYLLVNDRSTDNSVEIAQQFGFQIFHTGPEHFGLAAGRNVALANAEGDILVGIDADAVAEPNFLAEVENQFVRRPDLAGICGCLSEKYANDTIFDLWRSVHMRQNYGNAELNDPPILFGSSSAHRTEVLRRLGGWNLRFKTNFEDTDLTRRIRASGLRTLYAPSCQLWHLRRDTLESVLKGYWNWNYPPAEVSGLYDSLDRWIQGRLQWIWLDYRQRRLHDRATPQIAIATCLLPWSMTIRDLHQVFSRRGVSVDLNTIGVLARNIFVHFGANPAIADWMRKWLQELQASLPAQSGPAVSWDNQLLREIESAALQSIPDASYWPAVQAKFTNNA